MHKDIWDPRYQPGWRVCIGMLAQPEKEISQDMKLMYLRYGHYAGLNATAWPSVWELSRELRFSERKVRRVRDKLIRHKMLAHVGRVGDAEEYAFPAFDWHNIGAPDGTPAADLPSIGDHIVPGRFRGPNLPYAIAYSNLITGAKLMYPVLAWHHGKTGRIYATYETLGRDLGVTRQSAVDYVKPLKGAKLVHVDSGKQACTYNHYRLPKQPEGSAEARPCRLDDLFHYYTVALRRKGHAEPRRQMERLRCAMLEQFGDSLVKDLDVLQVSAFVRAREIEYGPKAAAAFQEMLDWAAEPERYKLKTAPVPRVTMEVANVPQVIGNS